MSGGAWRGRARRGLGLAVVVSLGWLAVVGTGPRPSAPPSELAFHALQQQLLREQADDPTAEQGGVVGQKRAFPRRLVEEGGQRGGLGLGADEHSDRDINHLVHPNDRLMAPLRHQHPHQLRPANTAAKRCPRGSFGRVGIFMVYTDAGKYGEAMNMMRCYAKSRGYDFFLINPFVDPTSVKACSGVQDVMFRKHCAAAEYLQRVDWLMVTDGDTAVVNTERCIEDFLDETAEVLLFERFFSSEIMSGSYLAQKSEGATRFMREWAGLEKVKPPEPHFFSADNGAVHLQVLRTLYPRRPLLHAYCMSLVRLSEWPEWEVGYGQFLRCAKRHMLEFSLGTVNQTGEPLPDVRLRLLPRAQAWCRDMGFSFYHFYPGDFISHNIKSGEPFDRDWLAELAKFWAPPEAAEAAEGEEGEEGKRGWDPGTAPLPPECSSADWRPRLNASESRLLSQEEMRQELAEAGKYFAQNDKLKPLFADEDIGVCWPHCQDVFRSYALPAPGDEPS